MSDVQNDVCIKTCWINIEMLKWQHSHWRIQVGRGVLVTHSPVQFLSFPCSFRQKSCQIIGFATSSGVGTPWEILNPPLVANLKPFSHRSRPTNKWMKKKRPSNLTRRDFKVRGSMVVTFHWALCRQPTESLKPKPSQKLDIRAPLINDTSCSSTSPTPRHASLILWENLGKLVFPSALGRKSQYPTFGLWWWSHQNWQTSICWSS